MEFREHEDRIFIGVQEKPERKSGFSRQIQKNVMVGPGAVLLLGGVLASILAVALSNGAVSGPIDV